MTPLAQDAQDIVDCASNLSALLLYSDRHMRTATGRKLLAAFRALAKRVYDAEAMRDRAIMERDRAMQQEQEQRTLVERLTSEVTR